VTRSDRDRRPFCRVDNAPLYRWDLVPLEAVFAEGFIYRYELTASGGIDMVATLNVDTYDGLQQVVFWKGLKPEYIAGVEVFQSDASGLVQVAEYSRAEFFAGAPDEAMVDRERSEPMVDSGTQGPLQVGNLAIDLAGLQVRKNGQPIDLTRAVMSRDRAPGRPPEGRVAQLVTLVGARRGGMLCDSAMFSVVTAEWPAVKSALTARITGVRAGSSP
jgi:hypothetical protein